MRILILEDNRDRWKKFTQNLIGNVEKIVKHTHEAIDLLKEEEWDALFLDHDFGGKVYCESGPGTGWKVAEWLSKNEDRAPKILATHSLHKVGRANICKILPGTMDIPGLWDNLQIVSGDIA